MGLHHVTNDLLQRLQAGDRNGNITLKSWELSTTHD
jgi:hypothetical protein